MKKEIAQGVKFASWLLIGMPFSSLAVECQVMRGFAGIEGAGAWSDNTSWNLNAHGFRNNQSIIGYLSGLSRCDVNQRLSAQLQAGFEAASQSHVPGIYQGKKNQGSPIINQAYATLTPQDSLLLDFGKIRKASGYLFTVSPLDMLRNTSGNMRSVKVNAQGNHWRNFYDEGSLGAGATWYRDNGTFEIAALPKLIRQRPKNTSAADWDMLERTNGTDRYYAAYTATGLDKFNPTVALLAGDTQVLALGTSGPVSDKLILNIEGALARGQRWRRLDSASGRAIQNLQTIPDPFQQKSSNINADFGVGLRYTNDSLTEYGLEYYGQSQGYSRSEWKNYFNTVQFVNGNYSQSIPPAYLSPGVVDGYRQYAQMIAAESDNVGRAGYLQGKHYLSAYMSTNKNEVMKVDATLSGLVNLVDQSSMVTLHLNTHLTERVESYVGITSSFGSERTEFGLFGEKGTAYAGIRVVW